MGYLPIQKKQPSHQNENAFPMPNVPMKAGMILNLDTLRALTSSSSAAFSTPV